MTQRFHQGTKISPGLALGRALCLYPLDPLSLERIQPGNPDQELKKFEEAKRILHEALEKKSADLISTEQADLLKVQQTLLDDEGLLEAIHSALKAPLCSATEAVRSVLDRQIAVLKRKKNEYLRTRALDFQGLRDELLRALHGQPLMLQAVLPKDQPVILITRSLTTSETACLDPKRVVGLVSESGGRTSHGAIMARALGIPALLNVSNISQHIRPGELLFLDGNQGYLACNLSEAELGHYRTELDAYQEQRAKLERLKEKPSQSKDGKELPLCANLAHPSEAEKAKQQGVDGVGLFRTEFLFLDRDRAPSEEEQFQAYASVLKAFPKQRVIIRTLDIGGDKPAPYLQLAKEANPFLGLRALRLCLRNPEGFKTQLRALLRAAIHGQLGLLLPMVVEIEEVRAVKQRLEEAKSELRNEGKPFGEAFPLGVMIETPASVFIANLLAREVDFFSIGSNDLTQYTLAADRTNEALQHWQDPLCPPVLRAIHHVVQAAHQANIWVGLCGELGGEPKAIPLLLGLGIDELSMSPFMVNPAKAVLLNTEYTEAKRLAEEILKLDSRAAIRQRLGFETGPAGF